MKKILEYLFGGLAGKIQLLLGIIFLVLFSVLGFLVYFKLEKNLVTWHKDKLKDKTELIYKMTGLYVNSSIKNYLTGAAESARKMAEYYYDLYKGGSLKERDAYNSLRSFFLDPDFSKIGLNGSIAALNSRGVFIIRTAGETDNAEQEEYVGEILRLKTTSGKGYIQGFMQNGKERVGAIEYFAPWDLIIWVSAFKSDLYSLIRIQDVGEMIKSIDRNKTTKDEYSFVIDNNGILLSHPSLEGQSILLNTDADNRYYIKEMLEMDEGQFYYPGENEHEKSNRRKMAYVKRFVFHEYTRFTIVSCITEESFYAPINAIRNILVIVFIISFFICTFLVSFIFRLLLKPLAVMKTVSDNIFAGDLRSRMAIDSRDELGQMASQFNTLIAKFEDLILSIKTSSEQILESAGILAGSSLQISSTSNEQSAAVREIISTMEDSDKLSKGIAVKVDDVANLAAKTEVTVLDGFAIIKDSLNKMEEIRNSNSVTIDSIQSLSEKIENIWDIVNIIIDIADQTKIIAFNADLEAATAGEAGKNFKIVASEIRRLADITVDSTKEIKKKISEIQHSSDSLVFASENGTTKITSEWKLLNNLEDVFKDILSSSEISANSAKEISHSINQLVNAFEQILLTVKQISGGIAYFAESMKATAMESDKLKTLADGLSVIIVDYKVGK